MRGRCSLEEKLFLEGQTNAFRAWKILHEWHEQIGPIAQINHIQKLLQLHYHKSERFVKTSLEISETVRHIYAMGMPTSETFSLIMMMNAMGNELPHVQDQIANVIVRSTPSNPYTPTMVHARLEMEQQLVNSKSLSSNHLALAASAKLAPSQRSSKVCTNPKCPPERQVGHTFPECFSKGGGRAGQRKAVLQEKAEKRCTVALSASKPGAVATGKPGNVRYDQAGCAYFVDPAMNTAFMLHESAGGSIASSSATQEFAGLAALLPLLSVHDTDEYKALFLDLVGLHTSVDWHAHSQPVDLTAVTYKAPNRRAPTVIDPSITPFFLDTGASIHISNCEADFFRLRPVAPHAIHGVGGSAIHTLGIGTICLVVAKGIHVTLDNVLSVPAATVHLISVSALMSSLKCVAHFADSTCWVTSANGNRILSGSLTAHRLYAISGRQLTADHAFLTTSIPILKTWHRLLGHANYRTVSDLLAQCCSAGTHSMHVPSSTPPPSCENCILGKQTRSPVPKVREGVQAGRRLGIVHVDLMEHPDHVSSSGTTSKHGWSPTALCTNSLPLTLLHKMAAWSVFTALSWVKPMQCDLMSRSQ